MHYLNFTLVITSPHHIHGMRMPIATGIVACSVCWSRSCALQKRLNQLWCCSGCGAQGTIYYMGAQIPPYRWKIFGGYWNGHTRSHPGYTGDAFRPTLEIMGTKCIWSPLTFESMAVIFFVGHCGNLRLCFAKPSSWMWGERETGEGEGMGETGVEQ